MNNKNIIEGKALERHFDLHEALNEFDKLFAYDKGDDRSIVIVGASYIDMILEHILLAFFPENENEVLKLLNNDQPLGTYGNRVRMLYCLGLIDEIIKDDLKLVGKIRNKFAHQLFASFEDTQIKSWCKELKWHKVSMMIKEIPSDATIRDLYQVGVHQLITYLNGIVSIARGEKRETRRNFKMFL